MALIEIEIGTDRRVWDSLDEVQENWIAQQITRRQRDGIPFCVNMSVHTAQINVALATGQCNGRVGGGRLPNGYERDVIDLWENRVTNDGRVNPGEIESFLKQLRRYI